MSKKKVMLITGASRGIGRFLCEYYVNEGWKVYGCSRKASNFSHDNYSHFQLSVTDEKEAKRLFSFIRKNEPSLDVLINNAGIASMNHSLLTSMESAQQVVNTNILGCFLFSREGAKLMSKNQFGRIVNFTTFAVPFKLEGEAIYAASKAAVQTLTEVLAREYAEFGITVNAVAPPAIKTDLIRGVPSEKIDRLIQRQAIPRFGKPDEVARVIDFFINSDNYMVTGQTVYLGGV